ncbi:MAG: hypothetical protein KDJ37_01795 [Hyphomicrobiaceae bacterium]|nr:hypothetical protein [Hyphomicrobiaceae bacterium]
MSYDFAWHARHGALTDSSARLTLQDLVAVLPIESVVDVGCGDGRWLRQCAGLGVPTIAGVDGPWTNADALVIPATCVTTTDLERQFTLDRRFDLAISLEVAEHLAPSASEQFVDNLVALSDCVLFGAAIPYQGGYRHINERWQTFWAGQFERHDYQAFDLFRYKLWNLASVHFWYKQNMLLYIKRERHDLTRAVNAHISRTGVRQLPIDLVHPEKYESIASYEQIAFKPLLRKLPGRAMHKARAILGGEI